MKFNRGKISKRQKVLFIVPLLLLTYALVFFAGAAYAVAPTAAWILNNNLSIQWKDSGGTARDIIYADASNQWKLCPAVASATCTTGDTAGNIVVGNGLVLTAIADAAKAGLLFLSSTTAKTLKYYDASSGLHSLAALDLAQTFTGAVTINSLTAASPTFSGTISGTYTFGGSPIFGTTPISSTDNTVDLGTANNRFTTFYAANRYAIYATNTDTYSTTSLESAALKFGAGAGNTMDVQIARQGANAISIYTNNGGSMIERLRFTGGAAQGSATIVAFEPITFTGTQIGTYTLAGTPTVGSSLAVSGTSLNLGSASAYFANIFGNLLTFEGASAGLAGSYNIGGTPTFTASPALSSGTTLPSGGLMMFSDIEQTSDTISLTSYCPAVGFVFALSGGATVPTSGCSGTESKVQMVLPTKGVVKNLYVTLATAPGGTTSWTITVRDAGANTALKCTITGTATTCSDTSDTASITKGDAIDVSYVPTGAVAATQVAQSFAIDQSG